VKESNVEMVLGFNEEEGMEDLRIEPKLDYNHFLECGTCFVGKYLLYF
jgi:hypothetical protein